ncbi:ribosome biogenesis factor YjgA [Alteromonas flava]|uniref:ribosome biogenesis factor YjgA n=1 Tax=Alteromonas flava TaxID=2048003 RepID=UPI000C28E68F|nr:ribosome biogenesis factor YjgA [Alteromonas flava]
MTASNFDPNDDWFAEDGWQETEEKSKSQLKREAEEKQKLALTLVDMSDAHLAKMPLDDELAESIQLARKINRKKDGFRRQIQFLGKLMRARDTTPIEKAVALLTSKHQLANAHFHYLETLRDSIVCQGDDAINAAVDKHPELERQKLRQLQRKASKEIAQQKPPAAAREIFKYLKESIQEQ